MTNKTINDLSSAGALDGTETIPIWQTATTYKATLSNFAPPVQVVRKTTPGSDSFVVPARINVIYISGCGGGGGGGGGYSGGATAGGGGGGGPAPMVWLMPLYVTAGATLTTFVGSGGALGAAGADGANGTETYISGAGILSPFKNGSNQILLGNGLKGIAGASGNGGDGGGAIIASTAASGYGTLNTGTGHASKWWYVADGFVPGGMLLPICQGSGGGATSANGGSRGSNGFTSISGSGLGLSGTGSGSGGGGGAGGGGGYGLGGAGGNAAGGAGGAGVGYGYGGGGGAGQTAGTGGAGTAGGPGILEIWY